MSLENQVSNLELSKRLKELNVKQESLFFYREILGEWKLTLSTKDTFKGFSTPKDLTELVGKDLGACSAFTVAELGEYIKLFIDKDELGFEEHKLGPVPEKPSDIFNVNFWAKMLIYLIENKLINL